MLSLSRTDAIEAGRRDALGSINSSGALMGIREPFTAVIHPSTIRARQLDATLKRNLWLMTE
jgi:hypothetical protein